MTAALPTHAARPPPGRRTSLLTRLERSHDLALFSAIHGTNFGPVFFNALARDLQRPRGQLFIDPLALMGLR